MPPHKQPQLLPDPPIDYDLMCAWWGCPRPAQCFVGDTPVCIDHLDKLRSFRSGASRREHPLDRRPSPKEVKSQ